MQNPVSPVSSAVYAIGMNHAAIQKAFLWLRRGLMIGFIIAYLTAGTYFLFGHLIGDTGRFAAGYFWTWDMFPNYPSFSARRFALGQTQRGQYVLVFPTDQVRHRRGGHGDLSRFDLPRNDGALRIAVSKELETHPPQGFEDPITYVFLVEKYWPTRFNLPDELYQSEFGEPNPHRVAYRILDEGPVDRLGVIRWTNAK